MEQRKVRLKHPIEIKDNGHVIKHIPVGATITITNVSNIKDADDSGWYYHHGNKVFTLHENDYEEIK